jgi:CubicO group peptidase (beta-lactamase class C family)
MGVTGWPKSNPGFYGAAGQWNDLNCSNLLSFAIEYTVDASFSNNILHIENLKVGEQTYWATLVLEECEAICFKIIDAGDTNYPVTKIFSEFADNVLTLERVSVGDSAYYVELELTNPSDLIFQLKSGSLTRSLTYVPADTDTWVKAEPEEVGLKSSEIQKAIDYAFAEGQNTQGLVILRHGAIVAERYAIGSDKDTIATSWSMAKSFVSALTGIAIEEGFISSVDVPAADYVTQWAGDDRKNITLKDLLLMSSGLYENGDDGPVMYVGLQDSDGNYIQDSNGEYQKVNNLQYSINRIVNPDRARWLGAGYTWNYSNADTQIIGHIIESASNKFINSFAEEFLFSKIGISADWWTDGFHNYMHYCCLDMTTRDFAKFGLLFARDGKWGSERIISEDWVLESTAPTITITESWQIGYGYQWWPDRSGDWYYAVGSRKQLIYVHPGLDIVAVRNGTLELIGNTKHRRGDSYHLTQFPAYWDNVEFFQYIIDAAKIN